MGFKQALSLIVAVYVDDIILACPSEVRMKQELCKTFQMKGLGSLHHFLGVKIIQTAQQISISQPVYTEKILERFGMADSKPVRTPISPEAKLTVCENPENVCNQQQYQAAVGIKTRPLHTLVARFCAKPTDGALKRILRYLRGTTCFGLSYKEATSLEAIWMLTGQGTLEIGNPPQDMYSF